VNEWNDQYSPQKPLHSPAKKLFNDAPIPSPSKLSSPTKRTKSDVLARKEWETRKLDLAQAFLTELDDQITAGQISSLSASTGGVTIIWSKTLNTTAGRAKWRAETTKSHRSDPAVPPTVVTRHFASIELAEKVLTFGEDAETRLLNVIAHEFCHLANFMVSKVKDQPHGASFKAWGRKVSLAFAHRGIQVTTKHSYEIEYKYVWACRGDDCGLEYKRHSKSIDLDKHRCGVCKGELVQVKPVPRAGGATKGGGVAGGDAVSGKVNGYAGFMKQHFADLKKSMPGASHKEVMEALGKKYRAEKEAKGKPQQPASTTDMDDMADKLAKVQLQVREVINLD
jgi:predicted SprT family Zn-dependent metalloprotease